MDGIKKVHHADSTFGPIVFFVDFCSFFETCRFEIEADLFDNHVELLFGVVFVGVGPAVGEGKLESFVGVLKFEGTSEGVSDVMENGGP
jgi:hypothetical protein